MDDPRGAQVSTDLQPLDLIRPEGVVNPETGELVALADLPTPALVRVLGLVQHSISAYLDALYEAKRVLGDEAISRMDKGGLWTMHAEGVSVEAPSPSRGTTGWDAEKLDEILSELVEEGIIDRAAKLRAVTPEVTLKVDKRGVTALEKLPVVKARIAPARSVNPQGVRKVKVSVDPRKL